MSQSLDRELKLVEELTKEGNYAEAMRRLDDLGKAFSTEARVWVARAYVNGRRQAKDEAIYSWTQAIASCGVEPHYFYMRGIELFQRTQFHKAILDFTKVIELCDFHQSDYYRAGAYFFRADAHLTLREIEQARSDCAHVPDEMRTWTDRIRTKADILAECAA